MDAVLSVWREEKTVTNEQHAQAMEIAHGKQNNKCACCGIKMLNGGLGIAFIDSNPNNLSEDNVRAVCKLCEALFRGGRLNKVHRGGFLVYFPQLSQKEIIRLTACYFWLKAEDPNKASIIQALQYEELKSINDLCEKYMGFKELSSMEELLSNMTESVYQKRKTALGPIRWWPDIEDEEIRSALRSYRSSGFMTMKDIEDLREQF